MGVCFQEGVLYVSLSLPHLLCGVLTVCERVLAESEPILVEAVAALVNSDRTQLCPLLFAVLVHSLLDIC